MATAANLVEIFSSVQGEGPDLGTSTLFVRFGGCDLRCRWCDSPHTWKPARICRIERTRGTGVFDECANPVSVETIAEAARSLEVAAHRFVSLTGGEPLLQADAAAAVARTLAALGPAVHLETHGLATPGLERVLPHVDVVSMDWKLASDVRRASDPEHLPPASFHDAHEAFLRVARNAPRCVVKVVLTPSTRDEELAEVVLRIARLAPGITLVLQPVTPCGPVTARPAPDQVLAWAARASQMITDVRVIPQTHPLLGVA